MGRIALRGLINAEVDASPKPDWIGLLYRWEQYCHRNTHAPWESDDGGSSFDRDRTFSALAWGFVELFRRIRVVVAPRERRPRKPP